VSAMYRDRAYCLRSSDDSIVLGRLSCANTACDRYVSETVRRLAEKAKLPIGWADLKTSKCGYQPREGQS
jgi:hypothetical protein